MTHGATAGEASARSRRQGTAGPVHLVRASFRLARQADRGLLRWTGGLQLLRAAALASQVIVVQWLLSALLTLEGPDPAAGQLIGSLAVITVLTAVIAAVGAILAEQQRLLGELTVRSVWERILAITGSVELEAFESPAFYNHLQRVESQAVGRPILVVHSLVGVLGGFAGAFGATIALLAIEPLLLPLVAAGAVPALLAARRVSRLEYGFAVAQTPRVRRRDYFASLLTARAEAAEVRAYDLAGSLAERYRKVNETFLSDLRRYLARRARILAAGGVAATVALAAAVGVVALLVADGRMTVAAAGAAIVGARLLGQQVSVLVSGIQAIAESGPFLEDLDDFLASAASKRKTAADATDPGDLEPVPLKGFEQVEVDGIGYRYPGASGLAIEDVTFTLRRGEVVALVGENGSGKTTLAKVMTGLLPATAGSVRFDGTPLGEHVPPIVRQQTAVVFQDFVRFQMSGRENIALGDVRRRAAEGAIAAAARKAGVLDALEALPGGIDCMLSKAFDNGVDLSTGTWQRIALARAFYRDAPFMLLDEPAAALDARAEHALFTTLRDLAEGRTVLFVSHRLATVRDADRILVMSQGRLIEDGTHDQLMAQGGRYSELFRLQAAAYRRAEVGVGL